MVGGFKMSAGRLSLLAAAGFLLVGGASAQAADLGGDCCADLEERIAELEATAARKGNRKVSLEVSGFVNQTIQWWDDGGEDNIYVGTNASDPTRFRFRGKAKITEDWSAGYLLEFGVHTARQQNFTAEGPGSENAIQVRHSAWYLESATFGKVTVGQTSASNDGITELSLAKSTTVAKPITIFTPNQSFRIRRNGDIAGNLTWGNLTPVSGPGEGDRFSVVRYDTPVFAGFTASATWGQDDLWAVALRYAGEFGGFKLAAGIGYSEASDSSRGLGLNSIVGDDSGNELGLSVSVLHVATGLFATFAYGEAERYNDEEYDNWHIQAGIQRKWLPLGATTLYGEYFEGDFGAANGSITDVGAVGASDVTVWGATAIQSIDAAAMDLYISYRNYEADLFDTAGARISGVEDFQTVFGGAKISF
jgi:hypothetical protein